MRDVYGCETAAEEPMLDRLLSWMTHSNVPEMRKVAKTVRENREGIPGYFDGRPANAYLEGANSLIQSIKRAARGFRNVEYLATAIFPGLGGLSFDALACDPTQPVLPTRNPEEPKNNRKRGMRDACLTISTVHRRNISRSIVCQRCSSRRSNQKVHAASRFSTRFTAHDYPSANGTAEVLRKLSQFW